MLTSLGNMDTASNCLMYLTRKVVIGLVVLDGKALSRVNIGQAFRLFGLGL